MNRLYYISSILIILIAFAIFARRFEKKKPRTREMVLVAVLSALTVAGRTAFFMLPHFKPMAALIIIAAVSFGKETGFLVGAVATLVSNFFFGQGPWTPWQMFAFGVIGYLAGWFFFGRKKPVGKLVLCIYSFVAIVVIYGGIMNPTTLLMYSKEVSKEALLAAFASGIPLDMLHGASTVLFLWLLSDTMREKLERIRRKYGILYFKK